VAKKKWRLVVGKTQKRRRVRSEGQLGKSKGGSLGGSKILRCEWGRLR